MGISDESKGVRVYWPDKKTVSTERNVYFDKTQSQVSRFEGEEWELTETKSHNPPLFISAALPVIPKPVPEVVFENEETPSEPETPIKRIHKLTVKLKEIIESHAVASNLPSAPKFTAGIQLPSNSDVPGDVLETDEPEDWMMAMEESLMAQTSEMEALEPPSLAVARKSPDWPAWEKAIHE